jgi:protein gp37
MNRTSIPYLTHTLNLWSGCTHCSPGCDNCWAESMAGRQAAMGTEHYADIVTGSGPKARWNGRIAYWPERLNELTQGKKPRVAGLNFMSDTFHLDVRYLAQAELFNRLFTSHFYGSRNVFVIATKRAKEMAAFGGRFGPPISLPNTIFLLTVCNQAEAEAKIPTFLQCRQYFPGALFGLSVEPMLGPIRLADEWLPFIDWTICGCESGPKRRLIQHQAYIMLEQQCNAAGVPFYLKQWHCDGRVFNKPFADTLGVPALLEGMLP